MKRSALLTLAIVFTLSYGLGLFALYNSFFGITSGEAKDVPFWDNVMFALPFAYICLSALFFVSVLLLFLIHMWWKFRPNNPTAPSEERQKQVQNKVLVGLAIVGLPLILLSLLISVFWITPQTPFLERSISNLTIFSPLLPGAGAVSAFYLYKKRA